MDNDYFTLCRRNNDLMDAYECCKKTCYQNYIPNIKTNLVKKDLCNSICNKIVDEDVSYKSDCGIEYGCWNDSWDSDCLREKSKDINKCCIYNCKRKNIYDNIDCKKYCKYYKLV